VPPRGPILREDAAAQQRIESGRAQSKAVVLEVGGKDSLDVCRVDGADGPRAEELLFECRAGFGNDVEEEVQHLLLPRLLEGLEQVIEPQGVFGTPWRGWQAAVAGGEETLGASLDLVFRSWFRAAKSGTE